MRFQYIPRPVAFSFENKDCAVRTYANVTGCTYDEARDLAFKHGRVSGKGTQWGTLRAMFDPLGVMYVGGGITIKSFIEAYPTGTYAVRISGHIFAVRDGVIYDTGSNRPRQRVTHFWRIENPGALPTSEHGVVNVVFTPRRTMAYRPPQQAMTRVVPTPMPAQQGGIPPHLLAILQGKVHAVNRMP